GVLAECEARGMAFLPYFPLASGLLTGKYRRGKKPPEGSRAEDAWGTKSIYGEKSGNRRVVDRIRVITRYSTWPSPGCFRANQPHRSSPARASPNKFARTRRQRIGN